MYSPLHQSKQHLLPKTASWDIIIVSVIAVMSMIVAITFDLHERFETWMLQFPIWRQWHLDDGIVCFVILLFALAIFSLRRWRELLREIKKREETEEALRREEELYQTLHNILAQKHSQAQH